MSINRKFFLVALGATLGFSAPQALAQSVTADFDVRIEIIASCAFTAGAPADLDFGQQDIFATEVLQQTDLNVTCTNGSPYQIALNAGANPLTAGDVNTRRMIGTGMQNSTDFVAYNLYHDDARSEVWGDTVDDSTLTSTGTGSLQTHIIYGLVPSTNHTVGTYSDTVTATVTF